MSHNYSQDADGYEQSGFSAAVSAAATAIGSIQQLSPADYGWRWVLAGSEVGIDLASHAEHSSAIRADSASHADAGRGARLGRWWEPSWWWAISQQLRATAVSGRVSQVECTQFHHGTGPAEHHGSAARQLTSRWHYLWRWF